MPATESNPVVLETAPRQRRSVFGNFAPSVESEATPGAAEVRPTGGTPRPCASAADAEATVGLPRSFLYQFLARAFEYPSPETWDWLGAVETQAAVRAAVDALEPARSGPLHQEQRVLEPGLNAGGWNRFQDDYIAAIGHAARGSCPINEIEYGDLKADPLFQPHRLADLAAFYRAFGLEWGAGADERHDHLAVELEFLAVLTAQEASLCAQPGPPEALAVCRDAQRRFLREHLARWTPAFARRLIRAVGEGPLAAVARFALVFLQAECERLGVKPGSEDLILRPADEAASLCDECGIRNLPPGAAPPA